MSTHWSRTGRAPCVWGLAIMAAALGGCGERTDSQDDSDVEDEVLGSASQALEPATCVTVRRGVQGNVHDAFLSGDYPTWKTGTEQSLWTGVSSGGDENRIILSFDLDFLPSYAIVTSASMTIFVSWSMYDTTVRAHEILSPWDEATVSASTFGAFSPSVLGSYQSGYGTWGTIDITALAKGWVDGSKANNGILLEEDPVVAHHSFSSESSLGVRPALSLCYVNGPGPHRGGALVAGGRTADSESYHFIGSMGQGPGNNHVGASETLRFVGGLVGATQE